MARNKNKEKFFDKFSNKMSKIAGLISAILIIVSFSTGIVSWLSNQISKDISDRITALETEVKAANVRTETQITRLELLNLMQNQPENVAEIEKVAKHYFRDLGGDWYATGLYSKWCAKYGGDPKIVAGVD